MNVTDFVPKRLLAGVIIIAATLVLAMTGNVSGEMALFAILGVGAALGVYEKVRGGDGS